MQVICSECGYLTKLSLEMWRCPACNGAWEPALLPTFAVNNIVTSDYSIWRYGKFLGLDVMEPSLQMGVGWTPLITARFFGRNVHIKLDYLQPTGSFKDRGVNAMVNQLVAMGVRSMVEDSSGNAGASLAAHGARFGIPTKIFVPENTPEAKRQQISVYGAELIIIPGTRSDTENTAQEEIRGDRTYASHAYHPAYLSGQLTAAFEVWEQLNKRVPNWIICPVGQGGIFLGFYFGFLMLLKSGLIEYLPRMVAVQPTNVAPLYQAWQQGLNRVPEVLPSNQTIATGAAIKKPVRGSRLLQAVMETSGFVIAVEETAILEAHKVLAQKGFFVESTSALALAGFKKIAGEILDDDIVLLPLTGNGLKS